MKWTLWKQRCNRNRKLLKTLIHLNVLIIKLNNGTFCSPWDVFKMSQTADVSLLAYDREHECTVVFGWIVTAPRIIPGAGAEASAGWILICVSYFYSFIFFSSVWSSPWVTLPPGVTLTHIHVSSSSHPDVLGAISALSIYQHQPRWVRLHCCLSELQCLLPGMWTGLLVWHQLLTSLPSPWLWPVRL